MAVSKKSTTKPVVKVIKASRKSNALHDRIVKLFQKPNGCTIQDLNSAGFKYSARQALRIAETRGLRTNVIKGKNGELTRYCAKRT
jgi:hypothetical protein